MDVESSLYYSLMLELDRATLIVFVSDSHIGGDPGCDGFESPAELEKLFLELADRDGPVELILAGDFFDFLQIGSVPDGMDRASLTTSRPEYAGLFAALRSFRSGEGNRVIYLPGNHDAEVWWNPRIQDALREQGLVDEFAFSYLSTMKAGGKRRIVYCEHGNQIDPQNRVEDHLDPLDTPLGHHVVMDFTRRIAPFGEVSPGLDLAEIKMVYPLVAIPQWIASRYFYNFLGKAVTHLLAPILVAYVLYRTLAYIMDVAAGDPLRFLQSYQELPRASALFTEMAGFLAVVLVIFAVFFVVVRRMVRHILRNVGSGHGPRYSPAESSQRKIRAMLEGKAPLQMGSLEKPETIDVFVSGHTHLPSLVELPRPEGGRQVMVNSGCWLRQLQPSPPRLEGPSVFVSRFVLTHVRVYVEGPELKVELWEQPKPASQRLTWIERLLSWNRRPAQPAPNSEPVTRAVSGV